MGKLEGKTVIVLGSSSGMGAASAELFAAEGANVVVAARRATEGEKVAADIRANGHEAIFIPCDATDPEAVKTLCDQTVERYGHLDLAMNCQGWNQLSLIRDMDDQLFDKIVKVCLNSMFYAIKYEAAKMMETGGGVILNVSSINAGCANNYQVAYCAAKAGLDMLTDVAAIEYGPDHIRVNTINPGLTSTALGDYIFNNDRAFAEFMQKTPLRTFARPDEIAKVSLFLLSDDARFISGEHLYMDGGVTVEGYPDAFRICMNDEKRYALPPDWKDRA